MTDLAWFPSAAMQTLGAMYAVFAAIYVLVVSKNSKHTAEKPEHPAETRLQKLERRVPHVYFMLLSAIVYFDIWVNAVILYGISLGELPDPSRYTRCLVFF